MADEPKAQIKITPPPGATEEGTREFIKALDVIASIADPDHDDDFMKQSEAQKKRAEK